jgi:hypothetical protein
MTNIEDKYKKHSVSETQLLILPPEYALEFVDDCKKAGYRILGVDGFIIKAGSTMSPIQHILTIPEEYDDSHKTAKDFIKSRKSENLFFEITYN